MTAVLSNIAAWGATIATWGPSITCFGEIATTIFLLKIIDNEENRTFLKDILPQIYEKIKIYAKIFGFFLQLAFFIPKASDLNTFLLL